MPHWICSSSVPGGTLVIGTKRGNELVVRRLGADGVLAPESLRVDLGRETGETKSVDMDISPDGKQIVIVESSEPIRLIDLQSGQTHEVPNMPPGHLQFVSWSPDGSSLYLLGMLGGEGATYWLRRLTLTGESEVLWQSEDAWASQIHPSPDGHRVAFNTLEWESDVWMIEGF